MTGLAYDATSGTTFGITSAFATRDVELITIDLNTGLETVVGKPNVPPNTFESLEFDPAGGTLVADFSGEVMPAGSSPVLLGAGAQVWEINPATAAAQVVGGGSLNGTVWAMASPDVGTAPPSLALRIPYYRGGPGTFTGFAVSNYSGDPANLSFRAFESSGSPAQLLLSNENFSAPGSRVPAGSITTNPAPFLLAPGTQLAMLGFEIFGAEATDNVSAWVEVTTDNPQVGSFFQFGTPNLSQLDGSVAIVDQGETLYLTNIFDGPAAFLGESANTTMVVVNPNDTQVSVSLTFADQTAPAGMLTRVIPPRGFIEESPADSFSGSTFDGYVKVQVVEGPGVIAFGKIELPDKQTVIGLNASRGNSGSTSFSAQLADTPTVFTLVNLINTAGVARAVTLRAIDADGNNLADSQLVNLQPGEQLRRSAADIFGLAPASKSVAGGAFEGSLRVEANGPGIAGDVIFGDPLFAYAAVLDLQATAFTRAVFSQVAELTGQFFTGLAFYNPASATNSVTVRVFNPAGGLVGETTIGLAPGARQAKLVSELVAAAAGQAGGYVLLEATHSLIAQLLFGAFGPGGAIQLFSAVPPTIIDAAPIVASGTVR